MKKNSQKIDGRVARKKESKQKLFAAASEILRTEGVEALTMRSLAKAANAAPATAYNVFGSKAELLKQMLERELTSEKVHLPNSCDPKPISTLVEHLDLTVDQWTQESSILVLLFKATQEEVSVAPYMMPRVFIVLRALFRRLQEIKVLEPDAPLTDLARRTVFSNAGLFDAWLGGHVTSGNLKREHRLNLLSAIMGSVTAEHRRAFERHLQETLNMKRDDDILSAVSEP